MSCYDPENAIGIIVSPWIQLLIHFQRASQDVLWKWRKFTNHFINQFGSIMEEEKACIHET
jgi:hypothetical protein